MKLAGGPFSVDALPENRVLSLEAFIADVRSINPFIEVSPLEKAFGFAFEAHKGQTRYSGAPYITHPIEVARLTATITPQSNAIIAALLHDIVEDTDYKQTRIEALFGDDVSQLVDGLTKIREIDKIANQSRAANQGETLRKLLLAITRDVRVLIIKMADRIHNMRTVFHMEEEKRKAFARETLDIYAPLAGRMGIMQVREELEDIAFRVIMPRRYAVIDNKVKDLSQTYQPLIKVVGDDLRGALEKKGIKAEVNSRIKRPFSIYRKMANRHIRFETLRDIYGFRILVDTVDDCYRALGVVHSSWPIVPGYFKDHISYPKKNDYRSLHTTVSNPLTGQFIELQIRTHEMQAIAEYGIASHTLYKDGLLSPGKTIEKESHAYAWLKDTISQLADNKLSAEEFLEHTKLAFFSDQIFAFTPGGDLIALPRGSTALDFAYAVHTLIGDRSIGCRIGGQDKPIDTPIRNGDQVEILVDKNQLAPPEAWIHHAQTGKARSAIRRALRDSQRIGEAHSGRTALAGTFSQRNKPLTEELIQAALSHFMMNSANDLFVAVHQEKISAQEVFQALFPHEINTPPDLSDLDKRLEEDWLALPGSQELLFRLPDGVPGKSEASKVFSRVKQIKSPPFGGPVPGERIIGLLYANGDLIIYNVESPTLASNNGAEWIDARWHGGGVKNRHITRLTMVSLNEPGSLFAIAKVITENDGNIEGLLMQSETKNYHTIIADIGVWSNRHISSILSQLRAQPTITSAERIHG